MKDLRGYLRSLLDPEFIPIGVKTALLVGTTLFAINHGAALLRGEMSRERWLAALLTYGMPYLVNVYGQYSYRQKLSVRE
jgi:hypothetical protein